MKLAITFDFARFVINRILLKAIEFFKSILFSSIDLSHFIIYINPHRHGGPVVYEPYLTRIWDPMKVLQLQVNQNNHAVKGSCLK